MRIILLIISLLLSLPLLSQKYNFNNFDKEEVKAKYIYDFAQDANGVLYAATSKGLLIYDGVEFKLLDKYSGLKDNFVSKIFIDPKSNIWLSYYKEGVTKLSTSFNGIVFKHFETDVVTSIIDEGDDITIITLENKIGKLKKGEDVFSYSINEYSALKIRDRIKLKNGKSIFIGDDGLYYLLNGKLTLIRETKYQYIKLLEENRETNYFTYEYDGILNVYQYEDKLRLVNEIDLIKVGISTKITDLCFDKDRIVISTLGQGLFEINFIDQRLQAFNHVNFNKDNGLFSDFIQSMFLDKEDNLWIGYYGEGISVFNQNRLLWYDESTGLENENILCVTNFKGDLAVGTDKGFSVIDAGSVLNFNAENGFQNDRVKSLLAQDNRLWIGTESNGLYYLEEGIITAFKFKTLEQQPTSINYIFYANGKLYLGTNSGLYVYSFEDGKEMHLGTNEGLVHNVIEYIYLDSKGRFWFDSPVSPIYSYKEGEFTLYKDVEGFDSFELSQIFETANKAILLATMGDGLFIYKDGEFVQYKTQNSGILSNYVYFIVEDMNHQIWMGHKNGLTRLILESNNFEQFNKKDNPLLKEVNTTSYQLSADNKLWIGTETGLVKINTGDFLSVVEFPEVLYKGLLVSDSVTYKDSLINLTYSDYQLEFKFQSIHLSNPKVVTYQYKLEGFDKQWNTVKYDKLSAKYQSVIDGEYTFRLKVCLENSCSEKEYIVKINIAKPYWKTTWAILIAIFLVLLIFLGIIYWINARRLQLTRVLELKVRRRTLELSKVNRIVGQKNVALQEINQEVLLQKKDLELKNKEIDDSIQYAKRIQSAFVVKDEYSVWRSIFDKTIILEKPRDIVSGDFYWGNKNDKYIYLAVADCTGHGVPGAMLSMLGIAFLDEIMIEEPYVSTNDLLYKLRAKVIKELFHIDDEFTVKEGMDITLVRIDLETKELQWSGANNPLYIIRETEQQCEQLKSLRNVELNQYSLAELKGDKEPIGFLHKLNQFTVHNLQLQKGDALYLITDGYADQFGGDRYKKFMSKRLKPLLISIHTLPEKEQYKILNSTFIDWMGDTDQIDDVCIAGLVI